MINENDISRVTVKAPTKKAAEDCLYEVQKAISKMSEEEWSEKVLKFNYINLFEKEQ